METVTDAFTDTVTHGAVTDPFPDTRPAGKAGGWYTDIVVDLADQISGFFAKVPETIDDSSLPIPGARIIIAPHAGYKYSGENAGWAYSCLDLSKAKRVFILGPNHTDDRLTGCAVTTFSKYATPFGDFTVDRDTLERVQEAGAMSNSRRIYDKAEHSLEMHLPLLYKRCEQTFKTPEEFPQIVPIIVGSTSRTDEKDLGRVLLSYLKDEENAFIISSDFCHWGWVQFSYTVYTADGDIGNMKHLQPSYTKPAGPPIYETIQLVDEAAMDAVESGSHDAFVDNLRHTGNTVCGRHPIGIAMAALELYAKEVNDEKKSRFRVVKYNRSNNVTRPDDFSVSYVSAYAIL
ncbi:MEMO1 family [Trichoderma austrokoningii]